MWVCNADGCKRAAHKRVWLHGAESAITKKRYRILIDICKKHYDAEKKAGTTMKDVLSYRSINDKR